MSRLELAALVFDLDDTLYPESLYVTSGYHAVAAEVARRWPQTATADEFYRRAQARFDRGETTRVFDSVLAEMEIAASPEEISALVDAYRGHAPTGLQLFADAAKALDFVDGKLPWGILTDGFLITQTRKIDGLALRDRCRAIVCTDTYGREHWKPHRHCFELMQKSLGVPHEKMAYIGDNPAKDFVAPNALGWTTIQVVRGSGVHGRNPVADGGSPGYRMGSLEELIALLA